MRSYLLGIFLLFLSLSTLFSCEEEHCQSLTIDNTTDRFMEFKVTVYSHDDVFEENLRIGAEHSEIFSFSVEESAGHDEHSDAHDEGSEGHDDHSDDHGECHQFSIEHGEDLLICITAVDPAFETILDTLCQHIHIAHGETFESTITWGYHQIEDVEESEWPLELYSDTATEH